MKLLLLSAGILFMILPGTSSYNGPGKSAILPVTDTLFAILIPETNPGTVPVENYLMEIDGTPFYRQLLWEPEEPENYEAQWGELKDEYAKPAGSYGAKRIQVQGMVARHLYINGCINSIDIPNPSWGGGDGYRNFFIGDTTGFLSITYRSGQVDTIPLVYGYTAWWHGCYAGHPEPFRSDREAREMLNGALRVINGIDGYKREKEEYYLKVALRKEPVEWIEVTDNPARIGYYRIDGLTFGNPDTRDRTMDPEYLIKKRSSGLSNEHALSIDAHLIASEDPFPQEKQEALNRGP